MPQITLEYTEGLQLDVRLTLLALKQALVETGLFLPDDIKSRAVRREQWLTGLEAGTAPFVHLQLAILTGRDLPARQRLSAAILPVLQAQVNGPVGTQLCVEVREMDKDSYAKTIL